MERYQNVRRAVLIDGLSRLGAARYFGIDRKTVDKMLRFAESAPHGRSGCTYSRKLAGFTDIIDKILEDDRTVRAKQRHTCVRILERRLSGSKNGWCRRNRTFPVVAPTGRNVPELGHFTPVAQK